MCGGEDGAADGEGDAIGDPEVVGCGDESEDGFIIGAALIIGDALIMGVALIMGEGSGEACA